MSSLKGSFDYSVDAKNRIRIPAKMKADLFDEPVESEDKVQKKFTVIFHLGTGGCIEVYTEDAYEDIYAQLASIKKSDKKRYKAASIYLRTFEPVESDPQGRLVIPPEYKKYARIDKEIKICGRGDHIQIWSPIGYNEYYGTDELDVEAVENLEDILGL